MAHDIHQQENQLVSREAQTLGSYDFHHCWRAVSRPLDTRTFGVHNGCIYGVGNGKWCRPASGTAHLLFIFWFLFKQILTCVSGVYGGFFPNRIKGGTTSSGLPLCLRHALSFKSDFWLGSFRPERRHQNVLQA